jgi:hypothetical protein
LTATPIGTSFLTPSFPAADAMCLSTIQHSLVEIVSLGLFFDGDVMRLIYLD